MFPVLIIAALGGLGVYFLTRKSSAASAPDDDPGAFYGFVAIPIPKEVGEPPATTDERKALKVLDRVIAFVQRPEHPKLAANMIVEAASGDALTTSFATVFARGKGWTDAEPYPAVGETFAMPRDFIYYVYAPGEPFTDAATAGKEEKI